MKRIIFGFVVVAAVVLSVALTSYTGAQTQRWEYKVMCLPQQGLDEKKINAVGAEGWELVSASASGDNSYSIFFCFKRRLP